MSKWFAVNETEICIRVLHGKDDFVAHAARRTHHACDPKPIEFDAVAVLASRRCAVPTAKILSSSRDVIVERSAAAPTTFEIPFH
ncbi:hypothetical protein CK489_19995 [Bradyrhizobium sp. UFLA03-84]|uniref:hypothetical protein n=1 Tax=Bradyrhizobium sp. UFLA03-84 TaxID=418599 RepID=UPI000BAE2915|nr:hypothetical protein [Bradyrhizobium sp. UFLA03-84]PAY07954.1 hypothetical protein CK489_19995 [Bradyrhizobium sp. UFLA03-84]